MDEIHEEVQIIVVDVNINLPRLKNLIVIPAPHLPLQDAMRILWFYPNGTTNGNHSGSISTTNCHPPYDILEGGNLVFHISGSKPTPGLSNMKQFEEFSAIMDKLDVEVQTVFVTVKNDFLSSREPPMILALSLLPMSIPLKMLVKVEILGSS
ncbi:hypothetical protein ACH5RR_040575 [Cinchona calisaya]|uniref:Uncharacterized protein n=1 Tax=Cinchona calisaya TaxID=153742 RepID=A0ABD2XSY7_9GENT